MTADQLLATGQMWFFIGLGFACACVGLSAPINAIRGRWFNKE